MDWKEFISEVKKADAETKKMMAMMTCSGVFVFFTMWLVGIMAGRA